MVKQLISVWFFALLSSSIPIIAAQVKIEAEIEKTVTAGVPLKGTVTIIHDKEDLVDVASFLIEAKALKVSFLKETENPKIKNTVFTVYQFTLPTKEPGLHVLPEIKVKVGNRVYKSVPATYEVKANPSAPAVAAPTKGTQDQIPIILILEEIIEGDTTIYPGQEIVVGYRFSYNFSFDLSKEELPLIGGEGLLKAGAKDTTQTKESDLNIFEIRQRLQAEKPGDYAFAPGVIAGRAYRTGKFGQKEIAPEESHAETKGVTIHVLPFPEEGKAGSFNGAIGTGLQFKLTLLSGDHISVQDSVDLLIEISGNGEFKTMPMPEICCQPGFSGFFQLSDLPPVEEILENKKTFKVEMRVLNSSIKEIPSLEFSYFNPKERTYTTLKSKPIPLAVAPLKEASPEEQKKPPPSQAKQGMEESQEEEAAKPESIEIEGNYPMRPEDLENLVFGTWKVLLILPFGIAFLFLQAHMKRFIEKKRQEEAPQKTSQDIFNEAFKTEVGSSSFFNLVQRAFLLRLVERGEISSEDISPDYLPPQGAPGKVKALMREIEERRFASVKGVFDEVILKKINHLFQELKHLSK